MVSRGDSSFTVMGDIEISFNDHLTNLDGLANLSVVDGAIRIRGNPILPQVDVDALVERLRRQRRRCRQWRGLGRSDWGS